MKIKITENANVKEVEISFGLSAKNKDFLKSFAEKTINTVVNTGAKAVKKVDEFIDKVAEEETRDFREHLNEIVEQAKEDAQRIADEAIEKYFNSNKKQCDEIDEDEKNLFYYLDCLNLYICEEYNSDFTQEAKKFMKAFKYPLTPCSIQAYRAALKVSEISFESIVNEIEILGETREDIIESLKVEFNVWLKKMPDVKENCPNVNLIQLLKYFVKKYNHEVTSVQEDLGTNQENENDTSYNIEEDDDYPNEVDEKETFEQKIAKIPEGKKFTLAEYLDYTEEFKGDISMNEVDLAKKFLDDIKFPKSLAANYAFACMLTLNKPSYDEIAKAITSEYCLGKHNDVDNIKFLKEEFEVWFERRTDVNKYCPKANLWQLLVYFRKKVKEAENN